MSDAGERTARRSWATTPATRRVMLANRDRDTTPELKLRRLLHARGLRYRLRCRVVPDTNRVVDIVFPRERIAVDVRGCFWHACPDHATWPKSNETYWTSKLHANVTRDLDTVRRL